MYLIIPDTLLNDKELTANEKLVLAFINSLKAQGKDCYISDRKLSKLLGIAQKNANHIINSLIAKKRIYAKIGAKNGKFSERSLILPHELKDSNGFEMSTVTALNRFIQKYGSK